MKLTIVADLLTDDIPVHAADCQDLGKYRGVTLHTTNYPEGFTTRSVWLDYNADFLMEEGEDGAYPLQFFPCCYKAGLIADHNYSW